MFTAEQIESSLAEVMEAYKTGPFHDAHTLRDKKLKEIHGPTTIKNIKTYDPEEYQQRKIQEAAFPFSLAQQLRALDDPNMNRAVVKNTAKAIELGIKAVGIWKLRELEAEGSVLFVPRPELDPAIERQFNGGDVATILGRRGDVEDEIKQVTEKIAEVITPAVGLPVGVSAFAVIVPYADQLVKISSGDFGNGYGSLVGVAACVSNVGIESARHLDKPLKTYSAKAYREWNLCLELDPTDGKIRDAKPPVGISRNLAGLERVYMPLTYFGEENMFYHPPRRKDRD